MPGTSDSFTSSRWRQFDAHKLNHTYFTYLSSSCPRHIRLIVSLHFALSCAAVLTWLQFFHPYDVFSLSVTWRQVVFGLPCLRLPSARSPELFWSHSFLRLLGYVQSMQDHFLLVIAVAMSVWFVSWYKSWFEMTFGQKILRMRLRHELWKVFNFCVSRLVSLHYSLPYNSTDLTLLL